MASKKSQTKSGRKFKRYRYALVVWETFDDRLLGDVIMFGTENECMRELKHLVASKEWKSEDLEIWTVHA